MNLHHSINQRHRLAAALAAVLAVAGCKQQAEPADATVATSPPVAQAPAPAQPQPAEPAQAAPPAPAAFNIDNVPISTAPLGDWPYFGMPEGYGLREVSDMRFEQAPFWTGQRIEWVEGRVLSALVKSTDGRSYAPREITHNLDALVRQLGGVRLVDGQVMPPEVERAIKDKNTHMTLFYGLLGIGHAPTTTWVVRRADRNLWMQFLANMQEGNLVIAESAPFQASAQLLAASQMKQQIDATGKVALQVNFATDRTEILPESMPQIEQVVQLLSEDPALSLSVNGHTDNTGDAAHNQTLSEGRAASVVAALTARGIDASRLASRGFGASQPVADNATDAGKASNRRVELVKR